MRILLVEDSKKLSSFIKRGLKAESYSVDCVYDGKTAEARALSEEYDLLILDLMLPKKDGVAVCMSLRKKDVNTPILMLTAKGELEDRVGGLNAGADDYLVKPFEFDELSARIRALLRRPQQKLPEIMMIRDIAIDNAQRRVTRANKDVPMSMKEFALLEFLVRNRNCVVEREQILNHCWGLSDADIPHTNVVDVYINKLRQKIEADDGSPLIRTVRGSGYMIED
jgi:DNA-binding response OmpR family regulator